jgi:hypothetical protein
MPLAKHRNHDFLDWAALPSDHPPQLGLRVLD